MCRIYLEQEGEAQSGETSEQKTMEILKLLSSTNMERFLERFCNQETLEMITNVMTFHFYV